MSVNDSTLTNSLTEASVGVFKRNEKFPARYEDRNLLP